MIRQRLINCDFLNASTFINGLGNKAKLLYLMMITNADDLGFVNNVHTIIEVLTNNDDESHQVNLELLKNDYTSALVELINKTYVYRFTDKHGNEIYVIKHWFMHNRWKQGLRTNYFTFYQMLELENGEYYFKGEGKKPLKENKEKKKKINESKVKYSSKEDLEEKANAIKEEWDKSMEEIYGMSSEDIAELEEREELEND